MSYRHPTKRPALALDTNIVQDNTPMEVGSKVYIGSIHAAFNQDALTSLGITHILNASRLPPTFPKQFTYLSVDVRDKEDANILSCIPATNIFIEAGIDAGGVLVHCFGGRSRSAAFVAAYLMSSNDWDYDRVFSMIKSVRPVASINKGFEMQLRAYGQANYDVYLAQQVLLRARIRSLRCIRYGHVDCKACRDVATGARGSSRSEAKGDRFPRSRPTSHSTTNNNSADAGRARSSITMTLSSEDLVKAGEDREREKERAAALQLQTAAASGIAAAAAATEIISPRTVDGVVNNNSAMHSPAATTAPSRVGSAGHKRSWGDSKDCQGAKDTKHESGLDSSMGDIVDVYDADEEEEEALRGAGIAGIPGIISGIAAGTPMHSMRASGVPPTTRHSHARRDSDGQGQLQGMSVDPKSPRCRLFRPGSNTVRVIPPLRGLERGFCCSWCNGALFCLANVLRLDLAAEIPLLEGAISAATGCCNGGAHLHGMNDAAMVTAEEKYHADTITPSMSLSMACVPMDVEYMGLDPGVLSTSNSVLASSPRGALQGHSLSVSGGTGIGRAASSSRYAAAAAGVRGFDAIDNSDAASIANAPTGAEAKTSVASSNTTMPFQMSVPKVPLFSAATPAHSNSQLYSQSGSFRHPTTMRGGSSKSFDFDIVPTPAPSVSSHSSGHTTGDISVGREDVPTIVPGGRSFGMQQGGHAGGRSHSLLMTIPQGDEESGESGATPNTEAVRLALEQRESGLSFTEGRPLTARFAPTLSSPERANTQHQESRVALDSSAPPKIRGPGSFALLDLKSSDKSDRKHTAADSPVHHSRPVSACAQGATDVSSVQTRSEDKGHDTAMAVDSDTDELLYDTNQSSVGIASRPQSHSQNHHQQQQPISSVAATAMQSPRWNIPSSLSTSPDVQKPTDSINANGAAAGSGSGLPTVDTSRRVYSRGPSATLVALNTSISPSADVPCNRSPESAPLSSRILSASAPSTGATVNGVERPQSVEKRRWLARMKLLGGSNSRVSSASRPSAPSSAGQGPGPSATIGSATRRRNYERESKVAKIAADDDEATKRALDGFVAGTCGVGHLHLEYLDWMGSEVLSAAVDEGEIRCRHCTKPIGNWTWTPSTRQTISGQLEAPLIRIHSSAVHPADFFLDPTPLSTPRPDDVAATAACSEEQHHQFQQAKSVLMEK